MPVIGERPELSLKTVIYATDFSLCCKNVGLYAARMAAYFPAKLLVTHDFTMEQTALEVEVGDGRESARISLKTSVSQSKRGAAAASIRAEIRKPVPFCSYSDDTSNGIEAF